MKKSIALICLEEGMFDEDSAHLNYALKDTNKKVICKFYRCGEKISLKQANGCLAEFYPVESRKKGEISISFYVIDLGQYEKRNILVLNIRKFSKSIEDIADMSKKTTFFSIKACGENDCFFYVFSQPGIFVYNNMQRITRLVNSIFYEPAKVFEVRV